MRFCADCIVALGCAERLTLRRIRIYGLARDGSLSGVDRVHCAGPRMKALHRALPANLRGEWRASSAELAKIAKRLLDAGDVAMVKGSLGARMIHVVDAIKTLGKARPALQNEEGS